MLLNRGEIVADGPVGDAIDQYLRAFESAASENLLERTDRDSRGWQIVRISGLEVRDASGSHPGVVVGGRPATITVHVTDVLAEMHCRLTIVNSLGQPITTFDTELSSIRDVRDPELGPRIKCEVGALPLLPGRYRIDVVLKARNQIQDGLMVAGFFDVEPGVLGERPMPVSGSDGDVVVDHLWRLPI